MQKLKIIIIALFALFVSTSCSLVDKIKEKMSSKKDDQTKEQTVDNKDGTQKEKTVDGDSGEDLNFYNKYIEVANKIQETGDGLNKSYLETIPAPKSVKKGMFLVSVAFDFKV